MKLYLIQHRLGITKYIMFEHRLHEQRLHRIISTLNTNTLILNMSSPSNDGCMLFASCGCAHKHFSHQKLHFRWLKMFIRDQHSQLPDHSWQRDNITEPE